MYYQLSRLGVVNCFQKLLSSWHDTTKAIISFAETQLWIAFKNYYLRDTTQHFNWKGIRVCSCELLSKIIIFVTRHNQCLANLQGRWVVNCFQKLLSSWHDTTSIIKARNLCQLWIAFKNYYLRDTTQPLMKTSHPHLGCELLSKIIIFVTRHNRVIISMVQTLVVNCFQKLLSSWHDTTVLQLKGQTIRCELLSKIIIFVTRHNWTGLLPELQIVVNCFQKLLSSWHDTTNQSTISNNTALWIAFKNYYLRDTTQRITLSRKPPRCCELLSKIIIFVTRHNFNLRIFVIGSVVNCFQKLLSSWHDTTIVFSWLEKCLLWIAFKNYYLRDTTQRVSLTELPM